MAAIVVLFTRDLRVHDNPALHTACARGQPVVPLFVRDPAVPSSPNRDRFLAESLAALRAALRQRGADLVVRRGDPVAEAVWIAGWTHATGITLARDISGYAARRERRLADECRSHRLSLTLCDGVTIVPPRTLRPSGGGDHYRVFTPYWRAWREQPWRAELPAPGRITLPNGTGPPGPGGRDRAAVPTDTGPIPQSVRGGSPDLPPGGEAAAHRRLDAWQRHAPGYPDHHDDLAADRTSRLSPYLHFGCVSPLVVASRVSGCEEFVRQFCWRDFHHQVLAAFPRLARDPYRPGAFDDWRVDPDALAAWQSGRTGVPIVDAGMRQLAVEGFLPNRARLITAGFLTRTLRMDWRYGLRWYQRWLVDADVANNAGNWQWVAGTGNDPRPNRGFNALRQARRFDPDGEYVRRWVPELGQIPGSAVHQPWLLPANRRPRHYPQPLAVTPG
jgi:deoxyribodipyrimidine photo-lyase